MANYIVVNTNERASRTFLESNRSAITLGRYTTIDWSKDRDQAKLKAAGIAPNFSMFPTAVYTVNGKTYYISNPSSIADAEAKRDAAIAAGEGDPDAPPESTGEFAKSLMENDTVVNELINAVGLSNFSVDTQAYITAMRTKHLG